MLIWSCCHEVLVIHKVQIAVTMQIVAKYHLLVKLRCVFLMVVQIFVYLNLLCCSVLLNCVDICFL